MPRVPHVPQILSGPLDARPSAAKTPDWVWYFAWDDDGGAFWRPTADGWVKATPSIGSASWHELELAPGWRALSNIAPRYRRMGGVVELRGSVSTSNGALSAITTLGKDCRPDDELRFTVTSSSGVATLCVQPDGAVCVDGNGDGLPRDVRLDGVHFGT